MGRAPVRGGGDLVSSPGAPVRAGVPAPNRDVILPVVVLVDVSNSMNIDVVTEDASDGHVTKRTRLSYLLDKLNRLPAELKKVGEARRGGELAMLAFGGNGIEPVDLRPIGARAGAPPTFVRLVEAELPKRLTAQGHTPLAEALEQAVSLVEERNEQLIGQPRLRANVWLITDGRNTDAAAGLPVPIPESTIHSLRQLEQRRVALFFSAMLPGANHAEIERVTPESSYEIDDADFWRITQLIAVSSQSITDRDASPDTIYTLVKDVFRS